MPFCPSLPRWETTSQHSALIPFFSKQMCFKVKRFFCGDTKPRSVSCREQGDVINPSDRDTMHSSLQMVQTLNGVTLSLSGHQKIKAPVKTNLDLVAHLNSWYFLFLFRKMGFLPASFIACAHFNIYLHPMRTETPSPCTSPRAHPIAAFIERCLGSFPQHFSLSRVSNIVVRTCSITP